MPQIPQISGPLTGGKTLTSGNSNTNPGNAEPFSINGVNPVQRPTGVTQKGGADVNANSPNISGSAVGSSGVPVARDPSMAVETLKDVFSGDLLENAKLNGYTELVGEIDDLTKAIYINPDKLMNEILTQEKDNTVFSDHPLFSILRQVSSESGADTKELIANLLKSLNYAMSRNEIITAVKSNIRFLADYFGQNTTLSKNLNALYQKWDSGDPVQNFEALKNETAALMRTISGSLQNDSRTEVLVPLVTHNLSRYNTNEYMMKDAFSQLMSQIPSASARDGLSKAFNAYVSDLIRNNANGYVPTADKSPDVSAEKAAILIYLSKLSGNEAANSTADTSNYPNTNNANNNPALNAPNSASLSQSPDSNQNNNQNIQGNQQSFNNGQNVQDNQQGFNNGQNVQGNQQGFNNGQNVQGNQQGLNNGQNVQGNQPGIDINGQNVQGDQQGFNNGQNVQGNQQGFNNEQNIQGNQQGLNNEQNVQGNQQGLNNEQNVQGNQQGFNNGQNIQGNQQGLNNEQNVQGNQQGFNNGQNVQGNQQGFNNGQNVQGNQQGFNNGQNVQGNQQGFNNGQNVQGNQQGLNNGQNIQGNQKNFNNGQNVQGNPAFNGDSLLQNVGQNGFTNQSNFDADNIQPNLAQGGRINSGEVGKASDIANGEQIRDNQIDLEKYRRTVSLSENRISYITNNFKSGVIKGRDAIDQLLSLLIPKNAPDAAEVMHTVVKGTDNLSDMVNFLNKVLENTPDVPERQTLCDAFESIIGDMAKNQEMPTQRFTGYESETMKALTSFIDRNVNHPAIRGIDNFNAANLLQSMLNAPGVFTPLAHYIIPLQVEDTRAFGELWVDNDNSSNKSDGENNEKHYHLFLTFDVEAVGRFEVDAYSKGSNLNLSVLYPKSYRYRVPSLTDKITKIAAGVGYNVQNFKTGILTKPHTLAETFPRIKENRRSFDVKA